jgi:hypothetical protein
MSVGALVACGLPAPKGFLKERRLDHLEGCGHARHLLRWDADVDHADPPRVLGPAFHEEPPLRQPEGRRRACADGHPEHPARIRAEARRDVGSHNRHIEGVRKLDRIRHDAGDVTGKARPEDRIDEARRLRKLLAPRRKRRRILDHRDPRREREEAVVVGAGIRREVARLRKQQDGDLAASRSEVARRDEAVATVVAAAGDHGDRSRPCAAGRENQARERFARALHEIERGDAAALDGGAVERAHLFGGDDFHAIPRDNRLISPAPRSRSHNPHRARP